MRLSKLATKTRKQAPADEAANNAKLLIQAGFIHKEMAGVYDYLPLGLMVFNHISDVIREEMNAIDGQEVHMSALQNKAIWEATDRWRHDVVDVWFKTQLQTGQEVGLGTTHEEPLTAMMREHINSYKDLPAYIYQFQTKFRNELRSKSGIMRTREFVMKDLYSFSANQQQHDDYYERAKQAYLKIFDRLGLGDKTYLTFASGGSFAKFSHEFQTVCDAGEDVIYVDEKQNIAVNKEVYTDEVLAELKLNKADLKEVKAAEVGNIFSLGTKFSEPLGLKFLDENGKEQAVVMGSYGIGPGRLMGVMVEAFADDKGLVWPENVAPAKVHIMTLGDDAQAKEVADKLYADLKDAGVRRLYDDRDISAGQKLADADLMGMPYRIVVSSKSIEQGGVELKSRTSDKPEFMSAEAALKQLT